MILFRSTRGGGETLRAHEAIRRGTAEDGGLYMPFLAKADHAASPPGSANFASFAAQLLTPFFADGPLAEILPEICAEAFDFDLPLSAPPGGDTLHVLELFHGPTGAFKDFGARFLFGCLDRLVGAGEAITVLAATSGDTGGAVGCAAEGGRARAVVLFPKGRVSPFQEHQLSCWRAPVLSLRVDADFDACQALVKQAFADTALSAKHGLCSANSINIGRLLPQMSYWSWAAHKLFAETNLRPGLIIPTGNLGNAVAALLARALGAPIGPVLLATNANATLADWDADGAYKPRASIATLANAMDVGAPSNFERLAALGENVFGVARIEDKAIKARMAASWAERDYLACPHTATALEAHARLAPRERERRLWIAAATAHPFKFSETVEAATGVCPPPSPALSAVLERPAHAADLRAEIGALADALE